MSTRICLLTHDGCPKYPHKLSACDSPAPHGVEIQVAEKAVCLVPLQTLVLLYSTTNWSETKRTYRKLSVFIRLALPLISVAFTLYRKWT